MARIEVEITHPDRVMFPADGITKGDLVDYYGEVADVMLAHVQGPAADAAAVPPRHRRAGLCPAGLRRLAAGLDGPGRGRKGGRHRRAPGRRSPRGPGMAGQPELHHAARVAVAADPPEQPDRLVFDLDPSTCDFAPVRAAAHARATYWRTSAAFLRADDGVAGVARRSTAGRDAGFDTARHFARDVAGVIAGDDPAHRTVELRKDKRGERIYLDVMRNGYAQTAVAAYGVRARRGAPVATPLEWDELENRGMRRTGSRSGM